MATRSRVVVLNGASSAGKTTIATGFRDQRAAVGDFWLLTGIDDFLTKLPAEWKSAGPDHGTFAADGIRFERTSDGVRVRVGRVGRQLLRAYQAGVAAAARVGRTSSSTKSSSTRRAGTTGPVRSQASTSSGSASGVPRRSLRNGTECAATDSLASRALRR